MMDRTVGLPSGVVQDGVFTKRIWQKNILWHPEPSFTFDKFLFENKRPFIKRIRVVVIEKGAVYELPIALFDKLKKEYNYGNGKGYRVPIKDWGKEGHQCELL